MHPRRGSSTDPAAEAEAGPRAGAAGECDTAGSPTAGGGSGPTAEADLMAVLTQRADAQGGTRISVAIGKLREEQAALKAQRKRVAKQLKNVQRQKKRLFANARQLSNKDLVSVLLMRKETEAARSAKRSSAASKDTCHAE